MLFSGELLVDILCLQDPSVLRRVGSREAILPINNAAVPNKVPDLRTNELEISIKHNRKKLLLHDAIPARLHIYPVIRAISVQNGKSILLYSHGKKRIYPEYHI
jgi:hypothetical protein